MKTVSFRFHNIQSHEDTSFTLYPGLNFILADDNNVGKSTIFKTLVIISRMPDVRNKDLQELLRAGCSEGYASFLIENSHRVTFWMFREGDRVRGFFEESLGYENVRSVNCPSILLEALDIMVGSDNQPINFNDADSVQLIVQDTPKNDEVLSRVLIDLKVEHLRSNSALLSRNIIQDYRVIYAQYQDSARILESISFNDTVDVFNAEKEVLMSGSRCMDLLGDVDFTSIQNIPFTLEDLLTLDVSLKVIEALNNSYSYESVDVPVFKDISVVESSLKLLSQLREADLSVFQRKDSDVSTMAVYNMQRAIRVLEQGSISLSSIRKIFVIDSELDSIKNEIANIYSELESRYKKVICPVKGEVFYGEECIPTGN